MYRQTITEIRQGDILEVNKIKRLPVKNKIRSHRQNDTTPIQRELNNRNAVNNLRLLMLENFYRGDFCFTLTYADEPTPTQAKRYLANFRQRLLRFYKNLTVKYITVTEYRPKKQQENKQRLHHHMILHIDGIKINVKDIIKLWGYGWVGIRVFGGTLEDAQRQASYFVKKKSNCFFTMPHIYKKRWNSSKNLQKPQRFTAVVYRKNWRKYPKNRKGYYIDNSSLINGYYSFSEGYEYEYQFYRLIRIQKRTSEPPPIKI